MGKKEGRGGEIEGEVGRLRGESETECKRRQKRLEAMSPPFSQEISLCHSLFEGAANDSELSPLNVTGTSENVS